MSVVDHYIMILRVLVFILIIPLGMTFGPQAANAQNTGKVYRIGWQGPNYGIYHEVFLKEFRRLGWVEGQDFAMEYRSVEGKFDHLAEHAAELVNLNVAVILANQTPSTRAARNATTTIPIVFTAVEDPVGDGFSRRLPGGLFVESGSGSDRTSGT
jgi:putative ABC transport system substrate-binding protein